MLAGDKVAEPLRRLSIVALAAVALSACGGLSLLGKSGPPPRVYDLSPNYAFDPGLPEVSWQLVVEEPYATGTVNTDRIAVRTGDFEFVYYKGVRWSERAPRMIQTRLVESFENSGKITAVGRQAIGLRSDYELKSDLREFQALLPASGEAVPEVWVRMNFKIVAHPSAQIVASMTAERRVRAPDEGISGIVFAFDRALGGVLKDAVQWTLRTAEAEERRKARERRVPNLDGG